MQFLSDVYLRCPDCDGRRFRADVLEVKIAPDGLSIAGVLDLTVDEAVARFADSPEIARKLAPLSAVGLGYLTLGQPVPSLSGGEAQRLKLAGHLGGLRPGKGTAGRRVADAEPGGGILFLFDEPTTGLHFDDVATLLGAFRALIAAGDSVVVIEHHLDVIAAADWIIDLGPEGGDRGGEIVCEGPPAAVAADPRSHTGRELRAHFAEERERGGATAGREAMGGASSTTGERSTANGGGSAAAMESEKRHLREGSRGPAARRAGAEAGAGGAAPRRPLRDIERPGVSPRGPRAAGPPPTPRPGRRRSTSAAPATTTSRTSTCASRASNSSRSPGSAGAGRAPSPSTSCSRRVSGAISSRSTPTPGSSCSRPPGPTWTQSSGSRRRSPSSSGRAAGGPRAPWRRPPRSTTSCACSS